MKFIYADWLVSCDDSFSIIKNGAIVFNEKILDLGSIEELREKYLNDKFEYMGTNSILMPGLINTHVHLEFSANKTTLKYGNFVKWLFSVIANREELIEKATQKLIDTELEKMVQNGTTTVGAISSYGFDMNSCIKSPINVVYFTEVLGSKADMIDTLFLDFQEKLKSAIANKSDSFTPAIAIHSPYSTHPFLIREVLKIAKSRDMAVSAHFQESKAENDWLNYSTGEFELFFKDMLDQHQSFTKPSEFLAQFKGIKNLSFTHCVEANEKELAQIKELGASVIHCPSSNRLLNNTILNLSYLDDIPLAMGTDGLSSNHTLNMFEEIRNSFFMHTNLEANDLAKKLLIAVTSGGASALGLKKGILRKDYDADIISFKLPDFIEDKENLAVSILLHTTDVDKTYIRGKDELNK
ncbi:MAG: aminofutalosine deaminase family hydrolase [Campylobacterota bacterium]|nr:aminofutalosine deaminase family hydrolase [Campylobacterota bacterium]